MPAATREPKTKMASITTDSRGNRSKTLPFVVIGFLLTTSKFAVAGLDLGPLGTAPEMSATAYGSAVLMIVGLWVGREWKQKDVERGTR